MGPRTAIIIAVLALNLPFVFQPFHIDDRVYLEIADNALENPRFPYDYAPLFEGILTPDAASHSHLPLISYALASIKFVTGSDAEWVYHVAFLIFPMLLAVSFFQITSRCIQRPLFAVFFLMLSPAVMIIGHSLMTEVALLAFWTLAIARTWRLLDGVGKSWDWVFLGLALACAAMMTLLSAGLVLLLAAMALMWGPPPEFATDQRKRVLLLLAMPILVWVLWYFFGYLHYDRLLLVRTVQHLDKRASFSLFLLGTKAVSFLLCLGGTIFFPLLPLALFGRRAFRWMGGLLGGAGATVQILMNSWGIWEGLFFGFLLGVGSMVFAGTIWAFLERRREAVLGDRARGARLLFLLWFLGILTAAILVYPSGSVRYVLLAFPPVIVAAFWSWERIRMVSPSWLATALTLSGLFSLSLSGADYAMASMYKRHAQDLVQQYQSEGHTVWFTAEWEFRYYLEKAGAKILARTQLGPEIGDIVIKPTVAFPWKTLYDGSKFLRLKEQRSAGAFPWIRLMDFSSRAGFYSTAWGILPYTISNDPDWERFNVFEVIKVYDGPIPEPEKHY